MKISFNPSGTHVHKQVLKARFDLVPDVGDKTYAGQHVFVVDETSAAWLAGYKGKLNAEGSPVNQAQYDAWIAGLPHIWRTNPCLSWFIAVPETFTVPDIETYLASLLNKDTIATLDNYLILPDSAHYVSPFTRSKPKFTAQKIVTTDIQSLVASVNTKLAVFGEKPLEGGGTVQVVQKQSISVGSAATNRASFLSTLTYTMMDGVASDGAGTIDTVNAWWASSGGVEDMYIGIFDNDANHTVRDNEQIGDITSGSAQQYASLDLTIDTGDFIGAKSKAAVACSLERDLSGGSNIYYVSGEYIDVGDSSASYDTLAADVLSLNGTGTEAGGGWANIAKVGGVTAAAMAKMNSVLVASIAKVNGVAV